MESSPSEDAPHLGDAADGAPDREGGTCDESREMEPTIRVHMKDDQQNGGTVENVSAVGILLVSIGVKDGAVCYSYCLACKKPRQRKTH